MRNERMKLRWQPVEASLLAQQLSIALGIKVYSKSQAVHIARLVEIYLITTLPWTTFGREKDPRADDKAD